jgi:serine/threonine protein kinase
VEGTAQLVQGPGADITTKELRDLGCGRTLGRYTLLRRIATGGMAEVYVARSKGISGFEKKVAIKKILPQHSHNERFIDMIVDEAKITVSLTHPNIAQVYELGLEGQDTYFIVMEYVDGRPLNKLMQRVDERGMLTIPVEHAAHVMSEVAKGLDHAHRQKDQRGNPLSIVHRDISPQNVLISYQGDVKLIDFGIARAEGRVAQTSHGVIKGKLRYLAPEIAMGEEPDGRADIFCCGIVLFEMLTGEAMFAPRSDLEAIEMASEARVRSPRSRNPKVPPDLDDIVMRALRRDRRDRFQSAKDLHTELRRFLNTHHPKFVGNELADFMQSMFAPEIGEERKLDAVAEQVAQESIDEAELEEPTFSGTSSDFGKARGYKQLVTHLGIGSDAEKRVNLFGADGGAPMGVVLDDSKMRPSLARSVSLKFPVTMPPHNPPGGEERAAEPVVLSAPQPYADFAEPTMRAENPFSEGPSVLPTIRGPAPGDVSAKIKSWEVDPSEPGESLDKTMDRDGAPTQAVERTTSYRFDDVAPPKRTAEPPSWRPPKRDSSSKARGEGSGGAWGYVFAFVAVAVAGGSFIFAGLYERPDQTPVVIPTRGSHVEAPRDQPGQQARELLTIEPVIVGPDEGERPVREEAESIEEDQPEVSPAPARSREVRSGTLFVNSRPVSTVYVDGKKKGVTPLRIRLTAGKHKVMLKGPDGDTRTMSKTISPGKTTTVVHRW